MDKELLKKILRESTLSEAKPVGLALTDKVKGEDKTENDAYYKEVEKKMSDYEKASTSSPSDAIEEPKFNYDYEDEVEYHKDMEIRNGMEMLNYERKPSEKFSQRAKEAIEGSSNMGNNPEWANVYPEQQGFTGPRFGKELAKTIKGSKEKRDAASELSNKNTTSVNATDFKDSAMTKRPKSIAISEDVSKTAKALTKQGIDPFNSDNWQKIGINEDANTDLELKNVAKQIFGILKKYQLKPSYEVDGKEFQSKEPQQGYGARIVIDNNGILTVAVYDRGIWQTLGRIDELDMGNVSYPNEKEVKAINGIASKIYNDIVTTLGNDKFEFRSNKEPDRYGNYVIQIRKKTTENNNKSEIKESTKMKRLKFKKPFNGIETALKVIPESYKVDNKIFEMTDGNENYKIRWEGSLTEGKAVVLTAYDKTLVKEDMDKIKHLMGFKSQETLGNLKGKQRIEENNIFADMLKKTRTLMTEGEDVKKGLTEGAINDLMVAAKAGTLGSDIDTIVAKNGKHEVIKAMQVLMNNGLIDAEGMRKIGLMQRIQKMTEGEAKPDFLDLNNNGDTTEPMKDAAEDAAEDAKEKPVSEGISWEQIMDGDKIKQLQVVPSRSFDSPEELENATMTIIGKLDDNKVKLKGNKDGKEYQFDIAGLRSVDDPANRVNFS